MIAELRVRITGESEIWIHKNSSTLLVRMPQHFTFFSSDPFAILATDTFFERGSRFKARRLVYTLRKICFDPSTRVRFAVWFIFGNFQHVPNHDSSSKFG